MAVARPPILAKEEASRRVALLCDLRSALAAQGVNSTIVRIHRLVLEGASTKCAPSGLTDPQLFVFTSAGTSIVTTNGRTYLLGSGRAYPVDDPANAAHGAAACHAVPGAAGRGPAGLALDRGARRFSDELLRPGVDHESTG